MKIYQCRYCERWETSQKDIMDHLQSNHAKEVSATKIALLRRQANPDNSEDLLNILEAIKEHTLKYLVDETDKQGVYSIDEALNSTEIHRLFQASETCGWNGCPHQELDSETVNRILLSQKGQ